MDQKLQPSLESPAEPPNGRYPARLDDKGRLKLPASFLNFFNELGERKLFVTSLDRRIAQIYPMSVWRTNKRMLETSRENQAAVKKIAFNAADLGADTEIDNQGRIVFNSDLRRALDMEGHELHLFAYKGRVEVLTEAIYQERKRAAEQDAAQSLEILESAGFM